jgi:hypothetical protein
MEKLLSEELGCKPYLGLILKCKAMVGLLNNM